MTTLALNVFKGMWPRSSRQQLPPDGAELAVNSNLLSGDLRPMRGAHPIKEFVSATERLRMAFRIPASFRDDVVSPPPASEYDDDDVWFTSDKLFTHFLKGPLVNDKYDRYYWTKPGERPRYAALADLVTGGPNAGADPYYLLGVPAPETAPTVVASGGTVALAETRCYVYTFVNSYGEESAPSPPTCAEGNADGTWDISGMDTAFIEPWASEGNPLQKIRIYRTVTGQSGGSFFFVDEVEPPAATYSDTIPSDEVSLNSQLESDAWATPPENLVGIVRHPNGFLVGFEEGGDLRFSVPYRPHAWPAAVALSTEGDIQALGIFGQSVAVLTNAHPYTATGTNPAGITLTKSDTSAPCLSRDSAVSFEDGVAYASPDGISAVGFQGVRLITRGVISTAEWVDRYLPAYLHATRDGASYLGVNIREDQTLERRGVIFAPGEPGSIWSEVDFRRQHRLEDLQTDIHNGDVLSIADNIVYSLDDSLSPPLNYQWKSTEFVTPRPINFGAFRIDFDQIIRFPEQSPESETVELYEVFNEARIANPLDTLNHHAINQVRTGFEVYVPPLQLPELKQPVGGSPLFDILSLSRASITVRLWGGRELRYSRLITEPGIYRLPEGYKTDLWQLELLGNAEVHHIKFAETGKELARV